MSATPVTDIMTSITGTPPTKLARRAGKKRPKEPIIYDNPKQELRRLVKIHHHIIKTSVMYRQSVSPRKNRKTGEIMPTLAPEFLQHDAKELAKKATAYANSLKDAMLVQLKLMPIYVHFLSKVYGLGTVCCAYYCAFIDFRKCEKPSSLNFYCGNCNMIDSHGNSVAVRRRAGVGPKEQDPDSPGTFNQVLKTNGWHGMMAMRKNGAKYTCCAVHDAERKAAGKKLDKKGFREKTLGCQECIKTERPYGTTTKYLRRWSEASYSRHIEGRHDGADTAGRRKATDLFLEDLYIIGRTLEGLSIRPDLYSVRRNKSHRFEGPVVDETRVLTLEEALNMVGDPDGYPARQPLLFKGVEDVESEESEETEEVA